MENASLDKIQRLIHKKAKELAASVRDKRGLVLIAGDVANSVEHVSAFYSSLSQLLPEMRIVAVLGNHELWDGDYELSGRRLLSDVISDYSASCVCTILENSLYAISNSEPVYIGEQELSEMPESELTAFCDKASLLIFGGVGFSGLCEDFNALHGLYGKTVSIVEDKTRSLRFGALYNKLVRCAPSRRVIVLTHTPMNNWSRDVYHPNWIYVSGHTHENILIQQENGVVVLSDNQIGDVPKRLSFKRFILSND